MNFNSTKVKNTSHLKIRRNDLCLCGSGKKYKKCCLINGYLKDIVKIKKSFNDMNSLKIERSEKFITGMQKSAQLAKATLEYVKPHILVGVTTKEIESLAHSFMLKHNAKSATLSYNGYPAAICTSVNEVVCHGIPNNEKLKDGDIINVDVSCILDGYFGDTSQTVLVGNVSSEAKKLVDVTKECLDLSINKVKAYGHIGDIGAVISNHAHKNGFSVVEKFVGHGIGTKFHEDPQIPHFGQVGRGEMILPGMIFTIEPMINQGIKDVKILEDGWTAITADRKLSAQFEHTILVTEESVITLTS